METATITEGPSGHCFRSQPGVSISWTGLKTTFVLDAAQAAFLCALPSRCARFDNSDFAFSNSARLAALRPRPARLMKYVSMRMPEPGPLGETFFEARV